MSEGGGGVILSRQASPFRRIMAKLNQVGNRDFDMPRHVSSESTN
jgi:hypothetical protein